MSIILEYDIEEISHLQETIPRCQENPENLTIDDRDQGDALIALTLPPLPI